MQPNSDDDNRDLFLTPLIIYDSNGDLVVANLIIIGLKRLIVLQNFIFTLNDWWVLYFFLFLINAPHIHKLINYLLPGFEDGDLF